MKRITDIWTVLFGTFIGVVFDQIIFGKKRRIKCEEYKENNEKTHEFFMVLLRWVDVHQQGRTLVDYFKRNSYNSVCIYGMRELGETLMRELRNSGIDVKYGIDRNASSIYSEIDVLTPEEILPPVDVVVVTAIHYYEDIEQEIGKKMNCPIVSLEDVVWEA